MALLPLPFSLRGVIYATSGSTGGTSVASRGRKRPGQHFLQSPASRTLSLAELMDMSEEDAEALFRKIRWAETDGHPICPHCGSHKHYPLPRYKRYKCAAKGCRKMFSVTVGTPFAHHKLSFKKMLLAIRQFSIGAKGMSAIALSKDLKCDYKTAFVLLHKMREAVELSMKDIRLSGTVEVDGQWFGGYVKPENVKINRVDRRTGPVRNGKQRVVVGLRERREKGRTIVSVFHQEHEARAWIVERCGREALIMADGGPGWTALHASHQVKQVNHDERYADGDVNTNQMESFFSRLGRFEVGTHHHIAGPYLLNYAADAAWRETNSRVDDKARAMAMLGAVLAAPQSRGFCGYWQNHGAHGGDRSADDFFANFV